jgi:oligosaccharide repeat unit polymerase
MTEPVARSEPQPRFTSIPFITAVAGGVATALAGLGELETPCILAAVVASGALLWLAIVIEENNPATLPCIFCLFHVMYGLSGPLSVVLGGGLNPVFEAPYATLHFLTCYGLATGGLAVGLVVADRARSGRTSERFGTGWLPGRTAGFAVLVGLAASATEVTNLVRAGGLGVLLRGKAVYQSAIADMAGTLPSESLAAAAAALLGLALASRSANRLAPARYVTGVVLALAPLLAIATVLGQRGQILNWILAATVAYSYGRGRIVLRPRMIGWALVIYVGLGSLYAGRAFFGPALGLGNWSSVIDVALTPERMTEALNPASNEFGAPFGNFNTYVANDPQPHELGSTYLESVILPVPRWIYPGAKPVQVGVNFRDRFFPAAADQGSIAGTAYSSILEAYVNFGAWGIAPVYLVVGLLVGLIDQRRPRTGSIGGGVFYALMVPAMIAFHRSDFADGAVIPTLFAAVIASLIVLSRELWQRAVESGPAPRLELLPPESSK